MRSFGLFALNRRLWQPAWLAVVLSPLVVLSCCAAADQSPGDLQERQSLAESINRPQRLQRIGGDGDYMNPHYSTVCRQFGGLGRPLDDDGARVVPKAAWPLGKSHVSRRDGERRPVASLGSFAAMPRGLMASAGPMPKTPSVLSAEYALLRRLEL